MDFKLDRNDIFAVLAVFLLSVGMWQYPAKNTLPDFSAAVQIREALSGGAVPLHIAFAAPLESAYASLIGAQPSSPQAIVSFLLVFPPFLLAVSSIFIYAALRALGIRKTIAAFATVLFSLSLSSLAFLPGVYTSASLAALAFSVFLLSFAYFISSKSMAALAPAALAGLAAGYVNPAFGVAGIAASLCYAAGAYGREKGRLLTFVLLAAVSAAGAFLSPGASSLSFSAAGVSSAFLLMPFLIAAASCAAVLFFFSASKAEWLLFAVAGIATAGVSPLAGALLLVFPAAEGMARASDEKAPRTALLACAFFIAFFAIVGIAYPISESYRAALAGVFLAPVFPLLLHFYGYKSQQLFFAIGLGLFALSLFTAVLYQFPPQREFFPSYADADLSSSLLYLSGKGVAQIGLPDRIDAAKFYLPSAGIMGAKDFSSYVSMGKPVPRSGTYLVLSLSQLDNPESGASGFEAYYFVANASDPGGSYAVFASSSGRVIARSLDAKGEFALRDGTLMDSSGRAYVSVPLSRMLMLSQKKAFSDPQNRLIVIEEGAGLPYFMRIYSGSAGELSEVSSFGKVSVYKVN